MFFLMTSIFACRVAHRIVNFCQVVPFFNIILSKKSLESIWHGCMSAIEYFIIGINKQWCLYFTVFFWLCTCLPLAPILFFSLCNLSCVDLVPYFFSPSHDCQFSKCLPHQENGSIGIFCHSHAFSSLGEKKSGKRFYFHFCLCCCC